ncbi:hypothetical protein GUITHDRAFT_153349 [Guillardia theta CCMP2712]|uniref:Dehydroascorbate reductase n=2 Tax=Guillardia theta TaxID=55529 RepID=L1J4S1_GUITC|nr:hypothetical protein GUITHDRAFT_153349 [Guillardia theta CCMP2712]EKX43090.1 hypothetical protein GUITHDRAFT_153349 [Guillardia theta CCMP2712]|eukprot:XP_005830070.1 hypothetical protein GUITHDRAFT_153349 [Guillardia theta CCMP2712]
MQGSRRLLLVLPLFLQIGSLEAFSFAPVNSAMRFGLSSSMHQISLIQRARLTLRGGHGLRMMVDGPRGNNVLYAKRGQHDGILGDCPYTHKAQMAMKAKDLQYEVCLVNLSDKPKWFLELNPKGTVPTYVTAEGKILTESDDIIQWCDLQEPKDFKMFQRPGGDEVWNVAKEVFPAFGEYMKNKDVSRNDELKAKLDAKLAALDSFLKGRNGPLLLGEQISAEDCKLTPQLYHISIAVPHYVKYDALEKYDNIKKYLNSAMQTDAFKKSAYTPETVIWGWSKFF